MAADSEDKGNDAKGSGTARELRGFQTMDKLLPALLQKYGLKSELAESKVFMAWEGIGKKLVGKTWPRRFRKGRLTVAVESSPQLMECVMMKAELLAELNAALVEEEVERLIFKIASKGKRHRNDE